MTIKVVTFFIFRYIMEDTKELTKQFWDAWDYNCDDEWAFGTEVVKNIPDLTWPIWATANQGKNRETRSACTMVWAMSQIQRLFQLDLSTEERNKLDIELVNYCVKKWYVIWQWWSTPTACNNVCKWRNEIWRHKFWKEEVFYLRVYWTDPLVLKVLEKWHLVGYSKSIQFGADQVAWFVWRDRYPTTTWHRLNLKWANHVIATGWAPRQWSKYWSEDNYHWQVWENFFIKDLKPYINKWVYAYVYIILPVSAMEDKTPEQIKDETETLKAVNALVWTLSTVWGSLPEDFQKKVSDLASDLRKSYPDARKLVDDEAKKHYQVIADQLSYNWKWADDKHKDAYWLLAKELRDKFWVQ